jgi:RNA binding exosome subunit
LQDARQRWGETLELQQQQLSDSLKIAVTETVGDHGNQLALLRSEFEAGLTRSVHTLAAAWQQIQEQAHADHAESRAELARHWTGFRDDLHSAAAQQIQMVGQLTQSLHDAVSGWQLDLRGATASAQDQLLEIRKQGEVLSRLAEQEAELIHLEERLARNLETVRVANSLEETILNLNAAVHLLTARTIAKAA